jgi:hypothetical protein
MKGISMRTLAFTTIFLLVAVFVQATEPVIVSDGDILLLKKRLEVAQANVEDSDAMYAAGAPGGTAASNASEHLALARAKINLYRATGETIQLLNAYEEQLKWANYFHAAVKAQFSSGNTTPKALREAELVAYEAEFELKMAKQENTKTNVVTELKTAAGVQYVIKDNTTQILFHGKPVEMPNDCVCCLKKMKNHHRILLPVQKVEQSACER